MWAMQLHHMLFKFCLHTSSYNMSLLPYHSYSYPNTNQTHVELINLFGCQCQWPLNKQGYFQALMCPHLPLNVLCFVGVSRSTSFCQLLLVLQSLNCSGKDKSSKGSFLVDTITMCSRKHKSNTK